MKHKRYLLISCGWYYPDGGMRDVVDSVDDKEAALLWFNEKVGYSSNINHASMSYQVFDCDEREVIAEWDSNS